MIILLYFIDCMKMLHPFMPFISEEIFSSYFDKSISISSYPEVNGAEHQNKFPALISMLKHVKTLVEARCYEKAILEVIPGDDVEEHDLLFIKALCKKISEVRAVRK
eukprot:GHVR01035382.1.p2 GENE.GHVR01035382.1~~GHVR01035382.1.p2  ORF type:complete len:107 (-),score=8.81 GHVR01035382.1:4089-4409(-)